MPKAQAWTVCVWLHFRAGNLTRAYRDVLLTLRTFRGAGGDCYPSHQTLADRAECCTRTVRRALEQGALLGLVSWTERRVRRGWRWLRASNCYSFATPAGAVQPGQRKPFPKRGTTGQSVRGKKREERKRLSREQQMALLPLPPGLPSLVEIGQARQAARDAAWLARRSGGIARQIE